jgi:Fur family zinc uptake transcriptional regulator
MAKPKPVAAHSSSASCAHPELHTHGAADFVRAVEQACRERGLNLTPIRAEALRQIAQAGKPVKAYDLLERMRGGPGASAPPTVYRALDFLLENGFIHRLVSINAFLACHHPLAQHVVPILICKACESAAELEDETLAAQLDALARAQRFEPSSSYLEVLGLCATCTGKGEG